MIYELREYTAVAGKLPELVARFRNHTLDLFARHGLDVVFISVTEVGDHSGAEVAYALRFESYDELQRKWAAFQSDPDWQKAKADSEAAGPLVANINRRILNSALFD